MTRFNCEIPNDRYILFQNKVGKRNMSEAVRVMIDLLLGNLSDADAKNLMERSIEIQTKVTELKEQIATQVACISESKAQLKEMEMIRVSITNSIQEAQEKEEAKTKKEQAETEKKEKEMKVAMADLEFNTAKDWARDNL